MKSVFFVFIFLFSLSASAEECTAVSILDVDTQEFEACRITVEWRADQEPLLRLKHPPDITDAQCKTYCQDYTLLSIQSRGERAIGEVQRPLIDLFLENHAGEYTELTKEPFLSASISDLVERYSRSDDTLDRVIVRSLQSAVREKNPNILLKDVYYTPVTEQDLSEADKDPDPEKSLNCSICREPIADQLKAGTEVVRVNCGSSNGGDVFCKECIKNFYQYDQRCPNCRGVIEPRP